MSVGIRLFSYGDNRVACRAVMLDQFLEQHIDTGLIQYHWRVETNANFVIHTHCHQKQLDGGKWTHKLLARIPNAKVTDTDAGCCGMAGSFGYEQEHAGLSRKIASQRLLPALQKNLDAVVVTNGFSCRHQIGSLAGRKAMHIAEVLRLYIN